MAYPLTQAPYWKLSGPGAGLLGASPMVVAQAAQGSSNGAQPSLTNVLQVDASQKFRIGSRAFFCDENYGEIEAIYLKGVSSLAQYDAVVYDTNQGTPQSVVRMITGADASLSGPVAIALSNPNGSQFGWFAVSGKVPVSTSGAIINESLAASGTAGQLTDGGDTLDVAGTITGMSCKSAQGGPATGFTDVQIDHPYCWEK